MMFELSPFGLFGNMGFFFAVALGMPTIYAFVWPGVASRLFPFFCTTLLIGFILAWVACQWYLIPASTIGTSGTPPSPDTALNEAKLASMLAKRFYIACCALVLFQLVVSKITQVVLSR